MFDSLSMRRYISKIEGSVGTSLWCFYHFNEQFNNFFPVKKIMAWNFEILKPSSSEDGQCFHEGLRPPSSCRSQWGQSRWVPLNSCLPGNRRCNLGLSESLERNNISEAVQPGATLKCILGWIQMFRELGVGGIVFIPCRMTFTKLHVNLVLLTHF